MTFRLYPLRLQFTASDSVRFPAGKPGNILRGAFGTIFRKLVCVPECTSVKSCDRRRECPYARLFEPAALGGGPSGQADWPRPFVFRAGHLDGKILHPGDSFHFDLNVFEMRDPALEYFVEAFAQIASEGLGQERGRAGLREVHLLDSTRLPVKQIYDGETKQMKDPGPPLSFEMAPGPDKVTRLRVQFATPTELKAGTRLAERPDFWVLFSRARDRISTLRALYQSGPFQIDFKAMGQRAAAVKMTRCEVQWREIARRSSRTGQVHPLGGFVGEAEYEGELAEFLPFLKMVEWTGVGRHTVWGKGAIIVSLL